jgi:hypothetical protein
MTDITRQLWPNASRDSLGLRLRGLYVTEADYAVNDAVMFENKLWRSKDAQRGVRPTLLDPITDDFNRADGPAGGSWTAGGYVAPTISGNRLARSGVYRAGVADDCDFQATMLTPPALSYSSPILAFGNSEPWGAPAFRGYYVLFYNSTVQFYRGTGSNPAQTAISTTFAAPGTQEGATMRFTVQNGTLNFYYNGDLIATVDDPDPLVGLDGDLVIDGFDGGALWDDFSYVPQNATWELLTVDIPPSSSTVPANSADPMGTEGSMAYDDGFLYVKTATGWTRTALETF